MFKTKIASFILVGLMAIGGSSMTVFAAEQTSPTITVKAFLEEKEITLEEAKEKKQAMEASGLTLEGLQAIEAMLEEKGITLDDVKLKQQELEASGFTLDGLQSIKVLLDEKGITLDEAKANFESKFLQFTQESGLTADEAKVKLQEMKDNGLTFEELKESKEASVEN